MRPCESCLHPISEMKCRGRYLEINFNFIYRVGFQYFFFPPPYCCACFCNKCIFDQWPNNPQRLFSALFRATTWKCQRCFGDAGRERGREGLEQTAFFCRITPSTSKAPVNKPRNTWPRQSMSCCKGAPGWAIRDQWGKLWSLRRI